MSEPPGVSDLGHPAQASRPIRNSALTAVFAVVTLLGLAGCHQLTNPADPDSPAYGGVPITTAPLDPDKSDYLPMLPEIAEWRSYAQHMPGQWIWQTITSGGSFVEPRGGTLLGIVFAEPFDHKLLDLVMVLIGVNRNGHLLNPPVMQFVKLSGPIWLPNGSIALYPYPGDADPLTGSRITIRVLNTDGSVLSERSFGWLYGDVNGDGIVNATDVAVVTGNQGRPPDSSNGRSDINADGVIDAADLAVVTDPPPPGMNGVSIGSVEVPDF